MKRWLCTALFAAFAATAPAQVGEISVSGGVSKFKNSSLNAADIGTLFSAGQGVLANSTELKSNFRLGFRFTLNTYRFFGHEFGYAYNRSKIVQDTGQYGMPVHQGFYNFLVYALPEGSRVRPFATGGVHFSTFNPPGTSTYSGGGSTKFGFNYGGGIKVKMTQILGLRLDFRDYATGRPKLYGFDISQPSGLLHQIEVSGGVAFYF